MSVSTNLNVTIGGKGYNIEVTGGEYEGADPSVGIMCGGFVSYSIDMAEDDIGDLLTKEALIELQATVEADVLSNDKVLAELEDAAKDDSEQDCDPADWRYR